MTRVWAHSARLTIAVVALFAVGAPAAAVVEKPASMKPSSSAGSVASSPADASTISRILDRWYPVASDLRQDVAVWRAQFSALLERASPETLRTIDAIEAKAAGPNRTLVQLFQSVQSMAIADVGAQIAKQLHSAKVAKLGSTMADLVFVPISPPCRIVDTRNTGLGISFGTQRNFYYFGNGTPASWGTLQGGDPGAASTACPGTVLTAAGGTLGTVAPAAAMANVTAVNTTAPGNFIAWGGSAGTIPNTSVLNWNAGQVISNTTIIPWGGRTGGNQDFAIRYNGPSGFSDVVVDVMGYFIENEATALDCTTATATDTINGAPVSSTADTSIAYPPCLPGYTRTGGFCNGSASGNSGIYLVETGAVSNPACVFRNLGINTAQGSAISVCCRVPGR